MDQDLADTRGGISADSWGRGFPNTPWVRTSPTPRDASADPWQSPSTLPPGSFPVKSGLPFWSPELPQFCLNTDQRLSPVTVTVFWPEAGKFPANTWEDLTGGLCHLSYSGHRLIPAC